MKSSDSIRKAILTTFAISFITILTACSSSIKGTASDKSGTNGATNGTGKVAKSL